MTFSPATWLTVPLAYGVGYLLSATAYSGNTTHKVYVFSRCRIRVCDIAGIPTCWRWAFWAHMPARRPALRLPVLHYALSASTALFMSFNNIAGFAFPIMGAPRLRRTPLFKFTSYSIPMGGSSSSFSSSARTGDLGSTASPPAYAVFVWLHDAGRRADIGRWWQPGATGRAEPPAPPSLGYIITMANMVPRWRRSCSTFQHDAEHHPKLATFPSARVRLVRVRYTTRTHKQKDTSTSFHAFTHTHAHTAL